MHQHHAVRQHVSHADLFMLACLIPEPKTATAWYAAVVQASGQGIEPGMFSRMLADLERCGWIAASRAEPSLRLYQVTDEGALVLERAEAQHQEKLQEGRYPNWQRGRKLIMWLVLWILRLYPLAWRERYVAEMVALLEQHQITLWTVLDLLVGALDARLDPHYRRLQQPHAWVRLQRSWKAIGSALTAFGFAFVVWVFATVDLGLPSDLNCSLYPTDMTCQLRVEITRLAPAIPNALNPLLNVLVTIILILVLCLLVVGAGWVLAHMRRAPLRNGARLLAFLALIPLWFVVANGPWWTLLLAVPAVALVAESVGAMLASSWRTVSRVSAWRRMATLVVGLIVSLSIVLICLIPAADSLAWWRLFLQSGHFVPLFVEILVPSAVMVLATLMVLVGFARSVWALRVLSTTSPRPQEPADCRVP